MTSAGTVDLAVILAIVLFVVGCGVVVKWIGAVADLIWMTLVRRRLTGSVLAIVGVAVIIPAVIMGVPPVTMILLVGLGVPLAARPICNWWAVREAGKDGLSSESPLKSLFDVERLRQRERYEAPTVNRRS